MPAELVLLKFGRVRHQLQSKRLAFDPVRISDLAAEHLQAAADGQGWLVRRHMRGDGAVEPAFAQPGQVGCHIFRPGQNQEVCGRDGCADVWPS